MTQRQRPTSSKLRGSKKRCERGQNCPYRHETQHNWEFSHDDEDGIRSNQNSMRSNAAAGSSTQRPFQGSGQRLGGPRLLYPRPPREAILRALDVRLITTDLSGAVDNVPRSIPEGERKDEGGSSSASSVLANKKVKQDIIGLTDD